MAERERPISLAELAAVIPRAEVVGDAQTRLHDIHYDSRRISSGSLFVALRGADHDGHAFVDSAIVAGASAVMIDRAGASERPPGVPAIIVEQTRAALSPISAKFFGYPGRELRLIGVTGTDGKTTTSYLLDHILNCLGHRTGLVGTVALRIAGREDRHALRQTTPESVEIQRLLRAMVDAGCDTGILEATSHGLDLHRLDDVPFTYGGVTNISHEHLEYHKTISAYRRAKAILFERIAAERGVAVINLDDEGAREMMRWASGALLMSYTRQRDPRAVLSLEGVDAKPEGSAFTMSYEGTYHNGFLPLVGDFNLENALCAIGLAVGTGATMPDVLNALRDAPAPPGRLAPVRVGQPFQVVVDYAHTAESLRNVLRLLRDLNPQSRIIVVFGSAGDRDRTKRPLQGAVAAEHADQIVLTSEDPRGEDPDRIIEEIAQGAREYGAIESETLHLVTERYEAMLKAFHIAEPGDVVLLAGKGHEGSIIWGKEKRPWDEAGAAVQALKECGYGTNDEA